MKPVMAGLFVAVLVLGHQWVYADSPPDGDYPFKLNRIKKGKPYSYPIGNDSIQAFLILVFDSDKAIDSAFVVGPGGQKYGIHDTTAGSYKSVFYIEIQDADYHAEITVTVRRPGKSIKITVRSKTTANKIEYVYGAGRLLWVQVGNYEETSAIKWSTGFQNSRFSRICYKSDAEDLDKEIFKRPLYLDSCFSHSSFGKLTRKTMRFGEVDTTYIFYSSGKLRQVSWDNRRTQFIVTMPFPGYASYPSNREYNRRGVVVRLHYFDREQDALIDIRYNNSGEPRRICKWFRETEECTWYRRDGTVRRTKSWERERFIHKVDWDFDIETLY